MLGGLNQNRDAILTRQAVRKFIDRARAVDMREDNLHARDSNKD